MRNNAAKGNKKPTKKPKTQTNKQKTKGGIGGKEWVKFFSLFLFFLKKGEIIADRNNPIKKKKMMWKERS